MICQIEALNYRILRRVSQSIAPFNILIGPNASGKTTFLDTIAFVGDLLTFGPIESIRRRGSSIEQMTWNGHGNQFELAIELVLPERLQRPQNNGAYTHCRYEIALGYSSENEVALLHEVFWLKSNKYEAKKATSPQLDLDFPRELPIVDSILVGPHRHSPAGWRKVVNKISKSGNDWFKAESGEWNNLFRLGPKKSALANLPEDEQKFPASVWAKRLFLEGVHRIVLNSLAMRAPCSPLSGKSFLPDGSNLPLVIREMRSDNPVRYQQWLAHVQTALPDIEAIEVHEREEDRHLFLRLVYKTGARFESWLVSDGTLRLLALTLIAYLPSDGAIYLIEEPENGLHPKAVEAVYQSLSSVYGNQILVASHSPIFLSLANPKEILCFGKTTNGATGIVVGNQHPKLKDWRGEVNLSVLFASGVLG
jgi:predicted ATPase